MAGEGLTFMRAGSTLWGAATGGAHFMLEPAPTNLGCPLYDVAMPHAHSGGDTLTYSESHNVIIFY